MLLFSSQITSTSAITASDLSHLKPPWQGCLCRCSKRCLPAHLLLDQFGVAALQLATQAAWRQSRQLGCWQTRGRDHLPRCWEHCQCCCLQERLQQLPALGTLAP